MTRDALLWKLAECAAMSDKEAGHAQADAALIEYLADEDVAAQYAAVTRWCA